MSNDSGAVDDDIFCYFGGDREGQHCLQCAHKNQQESRAVARKPHDAVVKFDKYQNLQRHRVVLPAIAQLFVTSEKAILYSLGKGLCSLSAFYIHCVNFIFGHIPKIYQCDQIQCSLNQICYD